jgi:hypothetical protein
MKVGKLLVISSLLLSAAAFADVKETKDFSLKISSEGRLSLENINGDIEIAGGSGDTVEITAHKKAGSEEYLGKMEILVDADDDYIRIEAKHPKSSGSGWSNWGDENNGSISFVLTVPAGIRLDTISTVNGSVEITEVDGAVKAETVNGDLDVSGLTSNVKLETVNGGIVADFDTLGGDQHVSAEAVNGKIVIRVPADASARINAETVNGSIDADDFGLEPEKGFVGRDLNGDIGDGDARISLDTVNGSIRINKK